MLRSRPGFTSVRVRAANGGWEGWIPAGSWIDLVTKEKPHVFASCLRTLKRNEPEGSALCDFLTLEVPTADVTKFQPYVHNCQLLSLLRADGSCNSNKKEITKDGSGQKTVKEN